MRLARLGAHLLAERGEALPRSAVGDLPLDPRQSLPDAGDLAARLPAAAEHAQTRGALASEVLRRDAARSAGAELPELVRLDHAGELRRLCVEEQDDKRRPARQPGVGFHSRETKLAIDRRHHGEDTFLEP